MSKQRVIRFTCASGSWIYTFAADDHQYAGVKALCDPYNTSEKWRARHCDGTAHLYEDATAALAGFNRFSEEELTNLDELMAHHDVSAHSTLARVLVALVSDPASTDDIWPPVEMAAADGALI